MSFSSEKQLLIDLSNGHVDAFHSIYAIYAPRLSRKLFQLLKSEELAQDVLQDIFIKVWEIRQTINPEQNFAAFLFKMAANRSKNIFRANVYNESMRNTIGQEISYNPIEDAMNEKDAKEILDAALNTLTSRQREVYTLQKLEGHSYQEISERLNISSSAINHHIQEAGKKLRMVLKNHQNEILIPLLSVLLKKYFF